MIRILGLFLTLLMATSSALAQGGDKPPAHHPQAGAMHDQMMKDMQANLDTMRATVQKMKDQLTKVTDASTRDQLQLNISLWEATVSDMDQHMKMMQSMMGHDEDMDHGKMADHRRMGHDEGMGEGKGMCCCCGSEGMSCARKALAPETPKAPKAK